MGTPAIRVEGIGKRFLLGSEPAPTLLKEALVKGARTFVRTISGARGGSRPDQTAALIWALRNVSFEVGKGEAIGIIGGNGAGKSTLLKILSRITEPTEGEAWIEGRVGSLLEVGTGFHGELSGRENTYLNGAILGMRRQEIDRKFDEIIAFAGVEPFIDTPVKRYSSGMYLRLAFAVAAHLETEILIVDEVLAVGDAEFQRKCLGRMNEVTQKGRTVLFVSHNMDAVRRLCTRSVLLDRGQVAAYGPTESVVRQYLANVALRVPPGERIDLASRPREGSGEIRFVEADYSGGGPHGSVQMGGPLTLRLIIRAPRRQRVDSFAATLRAPNGTPLVHADTARRGETLDIDAGQSEITLRVPALHLNPGLYPVALSMSASGGQVVFDRLDHAFELWVEEAGPLGYGATPENDGFVPCAAEVTITAHGMESVR
jgi:ABC-type polysaccharide/polyol phosphate transport system ATPase subunit